MAPNNNKSMDVNKNKNSDKKPFNKKKWREQKYSTKFKVQKWEEGRKKAMERKYKKELRKEGISFDGTAKSRTEAQRISKLKQAQLEYERQKSEDQEKAAEEKRVRDAKRKAIRAYQEKKAERFRKLNQKTKKGQPIMRGRMEMLQEKIERLVAENKL